MTLARTFSANGNRATAGGLPACPSVARSSRSNQSTSISFYCVVHRDFAPGDYEPFSTDDLATKIRGELDSA